MWWNAGVSPARERALPEPRDILTVDDICQHVRDLLEGELASVWVEGELSQVTLHRSGHLYATLRGRESLMSLVMFRGSLARLPFRPEEGQRVVVHGYLSLYVPQGKFQMVGDSMVLAGRGDLLREIEELKRRLAAEGLFESTRKRPLPFLPRWIGLVTSPDGAAIRDFLKKAWERYPARVLLAPASVQGERAAGEIVAALGMLARQPEVDVIVLTRGGGAAEDLAAFSNEAVVRAVAASPVPVVSAVGHEVDVVLTDFAADLRAPTPTAAGEIVVPRLDDLHAQIDALGQRLAQHLSTRCALLRRELLAAERGLASPERRVHRLLLRLADAERRLTPAASEVLQARGARLERVAERLRRRDPRRRLPELALRLERARATLEAGLRRRVQRLSSRLEARAAGLGALDPEGVLLRGYSITLDDDTGRVVRSVTAVGEGARLTTRLADGRLASTVTAVSAGRAPSGATADDATGGGHAS